MRALEESRISLLFFFLLFSIFFSLQANEVSPPSSLSSSSSRSKEGKEMMVPIMEEKFINGTRRKLGRFQICSVCTCCGGPKGLCLPSPCCFAINCNIPNRPFGYCSFTPKTCNCFGCHI